MNLAPEKLKQTPLKYEIRHLKHRKFKAIHILSSVLGVFINLNDDFNISYMIHFSSNFDFNVFIFSIVLNLIIFFKYKEISEF